MEMKKIITDRMTNSADFFLEIRLGERANPGKSCKDILDNGAATDDGEYWIDPEKRGRPLKVYCDMTTDGGE